MLNYNKGTDEYKNWILCEESFNSEYLGKCESTMALGNGYLGVRSAFEEPYIGQTRNLFVAGTYNKFDATEVTELPNAADAVNMRITLNAERFSLKTGKILEYSRYLNLKAAELVREILWESPKGEKYKLIFKRFVSLDDLHLIALKVTIVPLDCDAVISIKTGIDGRMTNSGSQHFSDGDKRVYDKEFLQLVQTTTETNIDFVVNCCCNNYIGDNTTTPIPFAKKEFCLERRSIFGVYQLEAKKDTGVTFVKYVNVFTSRDKEFTADGSSEALKSQSLEHIKAAQLKSYEVLFSKSKQHWTSYWEAVKVDLDSENDMDLLAVRFAQYHLLTMVPAHDERISVGAKALTGEGYKGHVFWDTEIFILPYYQYTIPSIARNLLKYRYLTLGGARNKAKKYGYKGVMYPWETAYTGEEETPEWAAINIMTGKPTRVWSGIKEHHITADIAYAVWQYYLSTGDYEFLSEYGCEIIFECAWFWCSRTEWNSECLRYEIKDIIGPDEYTEHIDNNAYTNYMAHYVIQLAVKLYTMICEKDKPLFKRLEQTLDLSERFSIYRAVAEKLYIPQQNTSGLIPQDDTFLSKGIIDILKYRENDLKQSILLDYTRDQIIDLQVLKQADVVMLLYTLKKLFDTETVKANWKYYESKTIHDSSLSMAVHSIVATYFNDITAAYKCFSKACQIDLGQNPVSSDPGIHAAAMGGIWMAAIFGFGGVFNNEGNLELNPVLPAEWSRLSFRLFWKNAHISIEVTKSEIRLTCDNNDAIDVKILGKEYVLKGNLVLKY